MTDKILKELGTYPKKISNVSYDIALDKDEAIIVSHIYVDGTYEKSIRDTIDIATDNNEGTSIDSFKYAYKYHVVPTTINGVTKKLYDEYILDNLRSYRSEVNPSLYYFNNASRRVRAYIREDILSSLDHILYKPITNERYIIDFASLNFHIGVLFNCVFVDYFGSLIFEREIEQTNYELALDNEISSYLVGEHSQFYLDCRLSYPKIIVSSPELITYDCIESLFSSRFFLEDVYNFITSQEVE